MRITDITTISTNKLNSNFGNLIMRDWNAAHEEMFKQDEIDETVIPAKINLNKTKDGKAAKWVKHVYDTLPPNPMNPDQVVLVYGEGEDQGLALIELEPDRYDADTANIKWIQTYPQRKGIGREAIKDLQDMAAEAGIHLSLTAWKHGKVPERVLKKFYKSMGFGQDTKSGQMKWTAPVNEAAADDVPQEVWEFLDTLHADDVGKERIGDYVVHFEGFTDVCQSDAAERLELPVSDPRHLDKYDDVYDEVIADFIGREAGDKPVSSGLVGDDLYPVVYAVFHKPVLDESQMNRIDQFEYDGGSLEGYVVDTDQPQLENYLTSQGASIDLVKALQSRYSRVGLIRNMWVDEEMRGGGIGSDMLEKAIGDAFAFGADAILLVADMAEDNSQLGKPLDKWYEGWGFKTSGITGSPAENEANATAGVIMRNWGKLHPDMFGDKPIETIKESRGHWLDDLVYEIRNNNKRSAKLEFQGLINGEDHNIAVIIDGMQDFADKIDIPYFIEQQKDILIKELLIIIKDLDEDDWPDKWQILKKNIDTIRSEGIRWPELDVIERSLKSDKLINEVADSRIISGQDMYKQFNSMHHESGLNPKMDDYILAHDWELTTVNPQVIPKIETLWDIDDPFDRIVDVDDDVVNKYINDIKQGIKLQPIILGPDNSIIDGNHRAQAYKKLNKPIPAYVTVES